MTCPLLEYRRTADGQSFEEPRAYCTGAERFVQPMRADICNDRYDLAHDRDCEIYRAHAEREDAAGGGGDGGDVESGSDEDEEAVEEP